MEDKDINKIDEQVWQTISNILRSEEVTNMRTQLINYCTFGKKDFNNLLKEYTSAIIAKTTIGVVELLDEKIEKLKLLIEQAS